MQACNFARDKPVSTELQKISYFPGGQLDFKRKADYFYDHANMH